ncbi:MAG: pyridoxal phosphate-dependent aminotransferase [Elusimicrobia bacterium]|jgi:aspartate aminotransferase|nr:pyridoxal phosphate-dependent aminotransferase [Elusimicrobiota bacterium]
MLSQLAQKISLSPTLSISAKAKELKAAGKDVISFGAGEPDFDTPDFIKEAAIKAINDGLTKYTPATGTKKLKNAIIKKFKRENVLVYSLNQIMVNCGAKHTLFNLLMCSAGPGDEVIIPSPYWVSYPEMVKASGAKVVIAKTSRDTSFKLTPEILENAVTDKSKILILNSPSNPTGTLYTKNELQDLGETILKNNLTVISDEIYEHLIYEENFYSIAGISPELKEKTIVVNGVSKAYAMTGWRIGYAAGDSEIIAGCAKLQSHSTSNPTSFAQAGAAEALSSAKSPGAIKSMVDDFRKRRDYIYAELSSIEKVEVTKPAGAFYIFPSVAKLFNDEIKNSSEFAEKLLEEELVAVVPGNGFGADGYFRMSYATGMDNITEGITRLKRFISNI